MILMLYVSIPPTAGGYLRVINRTRPIIFPLEHVIAVGRQPPLDLNGDLSGAEAQAGGQEFGDAYTSMGGAMYDQFRWTNASARRNRLTMEYEPVQPFFLMALTEAARCRTFIDVGANVGAYSLFATIVPTVKRVFAFEANPATVDELRANVGLNDLSTRVEVSRNAVSNAAGPIAFGVVSKLSGANSVISTSLHDPSSFHEELTAQAVRLDDALDRAVEAPLGIKIDVEGHERAVIEGAQRTLGENKAVIQIEGYEEGKDSASAELLELGYRKLTAIGPDLYFTNIEELFQSNAVINVYEAAMRRMIDYNHRNKAILLKRGDIALQLTGKTGDLARAAAKRLIGKHL